jgi:hypothetical protein
MIVAIVRFKLPAGTSLADAKALYEGSAPKYRDLPGLVRKHYVFGDGTGGGIYFWESRAAAEKLYTAEWRKMLTERYGTEPEIAWFENPVTVDNSEAAPATAA